MDEFFDNDEFEEDYEGLEYTGEPSLEEMAAMYQARINAGPPEDYPKFQLEGTMICLN